MSPSNRSYRLHPLQLIRLANGFGRRFLGNGAAFVSLEEINLLDKACKQTGLDDFGDESFRRPLRRLLDSFESDAELHFVGRLCVRHDTLRLLRNRLRLVADRKRFPEIAGESITRPLFITGLPRSGTTFLHALLAQDPASRSPQVWELMDPSPPPEKASYNTDPRIAPTARELKWIDVLMPDFQTVHLIEARLPQECIAIVSHDFRSHLFESMYKVSAYRAWYNVQDKRPAYEFHKQFLQHLQWRCPGRWWVLKAPSHLLCLEALFQVYPDAGIILTHRDPLKVLASCASFTGVLRRAFSDCVDKKAIASEVRERWVEGARYAVESHRNKKFNRDRFFDVLYADLVTDPLSVVRCLYRHFGLELTEDAEAAMHRFLAAHPQNKRGVHRYSLEEFGLHLETERFRFQFYLDFFGIEPEERLGLDK